MLNNDMTHIVLTRFNLAVKFSAGKRDGSTVPTECPWLDRDYLSKRFDVFERYTFASFLRQTDSDFKWIVMFHKDTPSEFIDKIKEFGSRMKQFEAWYLDDEESSKYALLIGDYIREKYTGKVITTRVDNDDIVHAKFICQIKKDANKCTTSTMLSYVNGLQWDTLKRECLSYYYPNNHFLSKVEIDVSQERNHILFYNHYYTKVEERCDKRTDFPMWIEVITDTNYSNATRWRFKSVFVPYEILDEYPMINPKWKNRFEWRVNSALGIIKVFIYRFIGLCKIIWKIFKKLVLNDC